MSCAHENRREGENLSGLRAVKAAWQPKINALQTPPPPRLGIWNSSPLQPDEGTDLASEMAVWESKPFLAGSWGTSTQHFSSACSADGRRNPRAQLGLRSRLSMCMRCALRVPSAHRKLRRNFQTACLIGGFEMKYDFQESSTRSY